MSELDTFRQETRAWLAENCPAEMRGEYNLDKHACWGGRNPQFSSDAQRLWLERAGERGYTVPTWPREYGGGGLSKAEAKVLDQEMSRIKAFVPLVSFGIWMLGPALLRYGNEEQKRKHLPKIARGEIRWCQGYSEPGSGSDLAGLQMAAVDQGDHYLLKGSKIWTSYGDKADMIFCLVRTDFEVPKHDGISFLLVDMDHPGVTTKPIKLISGTSPFCETFFDNAPALKENLVGELNQGWSVAKYLLTHEREMISAMGGRSGDTLARHAVEVIGLHEGKLADDYLRTHIAAYDLDRHAFELLLTRVQDEARAGQGVGAASAMLKYFGTELNKRRLELEMRVAGSTPLAEDAAGDYPKLAHDWLRSKGNSIEGGTSEIQLNIVARRILGLPKG